MEISSGYNYEVNVHGIAGPTAMATMTAQHSYLDSIRGTRAHSQSILTAQNSISILYKLHFYPTIYKLEIRSHINS